MDRMNSLDAVFIAIEDSVNHMHIGSVGIFDGPSPAFEDVRALVASKLHLVPRYRQRVREAPVSIGRPLWIDDLGFDLDYHVRHTSLAEGEPDALEHLVGRVMSQPLDRRRPLWEMWMIEGVGEGRWALLSKVHHCMVDGIAGSDLMSVVLDLEPDAPRLEPQAWEPAPEPSRLDLARYSAEMAIESAAGFARGGFDVVRHPTRAAERARDIVAGLGRIVSPAMGGGAEAILGPIGPHRRWVRTRVSLDDVKHIRVAFGGTVNDVVLAAVTRGFRELLKARGALDGTITTLIPVSTRAPDAHGVFDNRVSALYARLPVAIEDPVDTLTTVHAQMDELKQSHEIEASAAIISIGEVAPPAFTALLARTLVHSQEIVQTIATNVPGPQVPLYVCGRRMREAYPFVPIAGHIRISVAIWSYCGDMYFGITGDWDGATDLDVVARGIDGGFAALLHEAAVESL